MIFIMKKSKSNILGYVMILLIIIISYKIYKDSDFFQLKCVMSTVDGNKYCVRERAQINAASDLLAQTTVNMKQLVKHLEQKYPEQENVKQLVSNFN